MKFSTCVRNLKNNLLDTVKATVKRPCFLRMPVGLLYEKVGILVVSGTNRGFWSHLGADDETSPFFDV